MSELFLQPPYHDGQEQEESCASQDRVLDCVEPCMHSMSRGPFCNWDTNQPDPLMKSPDLALAHTCQWLLATYVIPERSCVNHF